MAKLFQLKTLLCLSLIALIFCFSTVNGECCGKVFDGGEKDIDIDRQSSTSSMEANWEGFPEAVDACVISEDQVSREISESGNGGSHKTRCRHEPGFDGDCDTHDFVQVNDDHYTFKDLDLERGRRYYVILRYKTDGELHYTNSDGIEPDPSDDESNDDSGSPHHEDDGTGGHRSGDSSSSSGDDDDDLEDWEIGLIFMGCALCCLLLLLLLLLILAKGKGEDKYTTTVHRNDNVDKL